MTEIIRFFRGEYWFLDNSYEVDINYQDIMYPSVTHAFFASQTPDPMLRAVISATPLPQLTSLEKAVGTPYRGWIPTKVMAELLEQKFGYSALRRPPTERIRRLMLHLVSTGDAYLLYGNWSHSQFFGQCVCPDHEKVEGKNVLGGLLMATRKKIIRAIVEMNDMEQTCGCENTPVGWLLYQIDGRPWLRAFCATCHSRAAIVVSHTAQNGIIRLERSSIPKDEQKKPERVHVNRQHLQGQDIKHIREIFDNNRSDENSQESIEEWMRNSHHPMVPWVRLTPEPERLFQSRLMNLSGRVKNGT